MDYLMPHSGGSKGVPQLPRHQSEMLGKKWT